MFMIRRSGALLAVIAMSASVSIALAQDSGTKKARPQAGAGAASGEGQGKGEAKGAGKGGQRGAKGERGGPRMGDALMQRLTTELELTADQQEQIKNVVQQHFDAVRQQNDQNNQGEKGEQIRAIREEMRKARESGDQAKLEELRKQLRELEGDGGDRREQMQKNMQELRTKITPLLNAEQQKKFAEMKFERPQGGGAGAGMDPRRLRGILQNLDLTKEQKTAAEEILKQARADMESIPEDDRAARMQLGQRVLGEVRNILTDEQKAKLEEQMAQQGRGRAKGDGAGKGDGSGEGKGRGRGHGGDAGTEDNPK